MLTVSIADQAASQWVVLALSVWAFLLLTKAASVAGRRERLPILALSAVCLLFAASYVLSLAGAEASLTADMRRGIGFVLFPSFIWFSRARIRRHDDANRVAEAVRQYGNK